MDVEKLASEAFLEVVELDSAERDRWLAANCSEEVRERVRALLRRHDAQAEWLRTPLIQRLASVVEPMGAPSTAETLLSAQTMLDHFRIDYKLGEGGISVVYLAEDTQLKRRVALKMLKESATLSEVAVARFRQEAITVAQLNHPTIVPVYHVGKARGIHYLVMELIEGPTFAEVIRDCEAREPGRIRSSEWQRRQATIIADIADALEHVHQKDIIHRDIKPTNIMIDATGAARLTDFGIAQNRRLERMTLTGQLAGTIAYMSPEQARASQKGVDHRTDIYSLGATLYEALTLHPPFRGESIEAIRQKILRSQPPPIHQFNGSVPGDLRTICGKALDKDPNHRYQTASQVASDLRSWLQRRPILARRPNVVRRVRLWARDHRGAVVAWLFVFLCAVIVGLSMFARYLARQAMPKVAFATNLVEAELTVQPLDDVWSQPVGAPAASARGELTDLWLDPGMYLFRATSKEGTLEAVRYVPGRRERFDFRDNIDRGEEVFAVILRMPPGGIDRSAMIQVPGGALMAEHPLSGEELSMSLAPFWIDACEVSNAQYKAFIDATGHPAPYHWRGTEAGLAYDPRLAERPVVGITLDDAAAYAAWIGKRLPTEWEWEYAMRQPGEALYPWRDAPRWLVDRENEVSSVSGGAKIEWGALLASYGRGTVDVRDARDASTALGIMHANTNVAEITVSVDTQGGLVSVVRGASFQGAALTTPLTRRHTFRWGTSSVHRGFRCVATAP